MLLYTSDSNLSIHLANIFKDLTNLKYKCILEHMAILPSIDNTNHKRELTDKQQAFLTHLVETQGDAKKAAELAGYSSHYHHVVKTLKSEILDYAEGILAQSAPKAALKLTSIIDSTAPIPQASIKLQAAQTILDRVGLAKTERIDLNVNSPTGLFILPSKNETVIEGSYAEKH